MAPPGSLQSTPILQHQISAIKLELLARRGGVEGLGWTGNFNGLPVVVWKIIFKPGSQTFKGRVAEIGYFKLLKGLAEGGFVRPNGGTSRAKQK